MSNEQILFSPIGATDPIRKMHDGPCLHIIRHYQPTRVVLFFTKEMGDKEKKNQYYTRPIRKIAPHIAIDYIFTNITAAHIYDEFMHSIPKEVYGLHEKYPRAEILMNISSGTPQMTTTMAILSMQELWCRPIQVMTPVHASNQNNKGDDQTDVETMMETNIDDDEDAENRCEEPELRALHYYEDRNRIESLINQYDYGAALAIAKRNTNIPKDVLQLLTHAYYRTILQSKKAKTALAKYKGITLCPFSGKKEELVEYFLTIQMEQRTHKLSHVLTQVVPFLYELLREYIDSHVNIHWEDLVEKVNKQRWICKRSIIEEHAPKLLDFLDEYFDKTANSKFRNSDLSALILMLICKYAHQEKLAKDEQIHVEMLSLIDKVENIIKMRNEVAHNMLNIEEAEFQARMNTNSADLIGTLFDMLSCIYGDEVRNVRNTYNQFNQWIMELLKK